jgi:GGDEF domain-containing protein
MSFSVGSATFDPADPEPLDVLVRRADAAMYEVKRGRRAARGADAPVVMRA